LNPIRLVLGWLSFLSDRRGPVVVLVVTTASLFLIVYLGAWSVSKDVQASALRRPADGLVIGGASEREARQLAWWEDGLLLACPLH